MTGRKNPAHSRVAISNQQQQLTRPTQEWDPEVYGNGVIVLIVHGNSSSLSYTEPLTDNGHKHEDHRTSKYNGRLIKKHKRLRNRLERWTFPLTIPS